MTNKESASSTTTTARNWYIAVLTVILSFAGLIWANFRYAQSNPGGEDFLVHWTAARAFIFIGQSPYSDETRIEISAMPSSGGTSKEDGALSVLVPLYAELLYGLFALISDPTVARAVWMSVLEIATVICGVLSIRLTGWRLSFWLVPFFLIFILVWPYGFQALIDGNVVVIVTLLCLAAFLAIQSDQDLVAGLFIALSTIKPHLVTLLICFILIWAISHRRWSLIGWFFGWLALLTLLGMVFIQNWLLQYIWAISDYLKSNTLSTIGSAFKEWWPGVGTQLNWGLTILLILLTAFEWWRSWGKGQDRFLWTALLTLTVSQWIGLRTSPTNITILLIPMVLIFSIIHERWVRLGDWIVLGLMVLLLAGLWGLQLDLVAHSDLARMVVIIYIPIPFVALVGLYWVRWWVIRPTRGITGRY